MDLQKTGLLLRALRKEAGLTQEQFAEKYGVSNRTVSRWENGANLPDIDLMLAIADDHKIDLRDLLNGERNCKLMNQEEKETVLDAVAYTNENTKRFTGRLNGLLVAGAVCWFIAELIQHTALNGIELFCNAAEFLSGGACGLVLFGIILTSRFGTKLRAFKQRLLKKPG